MNNALHLVCPRCDGVNRVPSDRLAQQPKCGKCHQPLFQARPLPLDEARFNQHLQRSGIPLLVDFWAPWCGPCRMEMPHIQALHEEMQGSGEVVFIGASNEDQKTIENWLQKNPYSFKMVMVKPEDAQTKYKVTSIPAGFAILGSAVRIPETKRVVRCNACAARASLQGI